MTYIPAHQNHDECLDTPIVVHTQNLARSLINRLASALLLRFGLMQRRKHLKTLGEMSNQHLSDIGLERGDIFEAMRLGKNVDVTCHLARVAQTRRQLSSNSVWRN